MTWRRVVSPAGTSTSFGGAEAGPDHFDPVATRCKRSGGGLASRSTERPVDVDRRVLRRTLSCSLARLRGRLWSRRVLLCGRALLWSSRSRRTSRSGSGAPPVRSSRVSPTPSCMSWCSFGSRRDRRTRASDGSCSLRASGRSRGAPARRAAAAAGRRSRPRPRRSSRHVDAASAGSPARAVSRTRRHDGRSSKRAPCQPPG